MPDRRKPGLTKPTLVALVVVVAGALAMTVALLSGSGSPNGGASGQNGENRAIEPVAPINPSDAEATQPADVGGKPLDVTNPFAVSFGAAGRRTVTVRVSGDGAVNVGVYYRDKKEPTQRLVTGSFSKTRTFEGRFPMVAVAIQVPGNVPGTATRATCTIEIDGIEVVTKSTKRAGALPTLCVG